MPIDPKFFKAVIVTIFIALGAFVGYQLVSDADSEEATETFEEIEGMMNDEQSDSYYGEYSEKDIEEFESSLSGGRDTLGSVDGVDYGLDFNNSFEHTKPGEYSEIVVDTGGLEPGEFTIMYVRKAGTEEYIEAGGQEHTVGPDGRISTRFPITEYGDYEVTFSYQGEEVVSPIITVQ